MSNMINITSNETIATLPEWVYYQQIVYLGIISLIGIPGNILVIIVFVYSRDKITTDYIVCSMAITDLFGSLVVASFSMLQEVRNLVWLHISLAWFERIGDFFSIVTNVNSEWLIALAAFDRYLKTCRPHSVFFTVSRARWVCVVICAIVPTVIGPPFFTTPSDANISTCLLDSECDWFLYYFIIGIGSCLSYLITAIAYILVAFTLGKRLKKKIKKRRALNRFKTTGSRVKANAGNKIEDHVVKTSVQNASEENGSGEAKTIPVDVDKIYVIEKELNIPKADERSKATSKRFETQGMDTVLKEESKKVNRTTFIMFLITAINIITFILLYIGQMVYEDNLSHEGNVLMAIGYIIRWSFTVNYIANPILYMSMSSKFRESVRSLFKRH